ncbi:uncharacterized protein A4U43_C01F34010 [Asparagus officinalis]|uniref:Uncharacterized protein n=1 Tax=Asparagus officinalis TaxID=4686 RepID=A0A5P1FXI4_ASPOF|nr:uncharacterized protein A4U43_C01F34010 [Asparagus officinalis]
MGIKEFVITFILTSLLLSLLLIPSLLLTKPTPSPSSSLPPRLRVGPPASFAYLIATPTGPPPEPSRPSTTLQTLPASPGPRRLHLGSTPALRRLVSGHPVFSRSSRRPEAQLGHLQRTNNACDHSPRHGDLAEELRVGLVHQLERLRLPFDHPRCNKRAKPIMIDPALYSLNKSDLIWSTNQRSLPTAFKLFTGSAWTVLSRSFAEYCIIGYDNLPRTLLLYYTNFVSSPEGYFQTLICNSKEFKNSTVNHDLHYIAWDNPPKQHPKPLTVKDYRRLVLSSLPFARKFKKNDAVLDKIDKEMLRRRKNQFSYGGWCADGRICNGGGKRKEKKMGGLRPGPGSRRLKSLLTKLLSSRNFGRRQCK